LCDKSQGPPANGDSLGANLERFLNGQFVKNGLNWGTVNVTNYTTLVGLQTSSKFLDLTGEV
jgi:hypothetical protein